MQVVWIADQFLSLLREKGGLDSIELDSTLGESSRFEGEVTFVDFGDAPMRSLAFELIEVVCNEVETSIKRRIWNAICSHCTLLLKLPDGIVTIWIWPLLFKEPSPSLLFCLYRVR